ncbi:MAG: hypothetical protein Q9227_008667 [Pyrenula ochraceoflavens]
MYYIFFWIYLLAATALSTPHSPRSGRKRQLGAFPDGLVTGTLGALQGTLGEAASYDYVVVGGGTAGITIGVRLAESGASVAIIEAGGYYELGAKFYDISKSYTFDNVLPHYQRSPHFTPPNTDTRATNASAEYNAGAFAASGGPLEVSFANYAQPFSSWMELALHETGVKETGDFNSGSILGSQYCTSTIRPSDESRSTSESSFLESAKSSQLSNLKVYPNTLAQRIFFDGHSNATSNASTKRTTSGVLVESDGLTYAINATKESPQILMLSGIGPRATLEEFDIGVVSDLPGVGQNMWDHITFGPSYPVGVDSLTKEIRDPVYLAQQLLAYELTQTGPLTNPVSDFLGWEKIPESLRANFSEDTKQKLAQFPPDWPEIEYLSGAGYVGDFSSLATMQPLDGKNYATILMALIAPLSRGNVTISSSSASDLPIINPNWLSDPADQQVAIAAFRRAREAFASDAMAPVLLDNGREYYPGEDVQTDEQILESIRNSMHTLWHAACTCKMGRPGEEADGAVLDSQARVLGVNGLRVVDASAFPILVPGHPQSTIYMLAEKIASLMIGDAA